MALWTTLLLTNTSAVYLLRPRPAAPPPRRAGPAASTSSSAASTTAAAPSTSAAPAALPPPMPQLPASERPPAGSLAGGCPAHFWAGGDATKFNVRVGPDYPRQGLKAASGPGLYQLLTVDLVRCNSRLDHAARHVQLPSPPEGGADGPLAPIFVVNIQMPLSAPSALGGTDPASEPTFSIVAYFGCSAEAQAEARSDAPRAGVKLLKEYCAKASCPPPLPRSLRAAAPGSAPSTSPCPPRLGELGSPSQ